MPLQHAAVPLTPPVPNQSRPRLVHHRPASHAAAGGGGASEDIYFDIVNKQGTVVREQPVVCVSGSPPQHTDTDRQTDRLIDRQTD